MVETICHTFLIHPLLIIASKFYIDISDTLIGLDVFLLLLADV